VQRQLGPLGAGTCFVAGTLVQPPPWLAALLLVLVAVAAVPSLLRGAAVLGGTRSRPARALVVGHGVETAKEALRLRARSGNRLHGVAWCEPSGLEDAMVRHRPDVVVALPSAGLAGRALRRLTWRLEAAGIPLFIGSRLDDLMPFRAQVVRIGSVGLVHVRPAARARLQRALKSSWERLAAVAGILVIAPVLLLIAVAIKLDSRGPVVFRQERVGRDGRPFTMLKFRTMTVDAETRREQLRNDCDGVLFKSREDPRITAVGRILRRYSLDELPQLVNVIRGQMALVGPRPALFSEVAQYDGDALRRLTLLPGMTGLWQVSGRSDLPWEEAVRLDLDYVDNWSLVLDVRIIARTARAVLGHSGAY
jgi:exopolysaccharide biosynthesis polyprenyl glycosylphosphotransferase